MDAEQIAVTIRDAIRDIPKRHGDNSRRISDIEKETDDIMHLIELTSFNAAEGYKIAKQLKEIRMERRILKDENDLLRPMINELSGLKHKRNAWDNAIGNIRKEKEWKKDRFYKCKHRIDLQDKINEVKL